MDPDSVRTVERVPHGGSHDPTVLDFSANTNPEHPPGVVGVYGAALAAARRYPDDDYAEFRHAGAEYVGRDPREVIPTPGALVALRLALDVSVAPGDSVLVPAPSFGEYVREVRLQGSDPVVVPYDELLDRDPAGHAAAIACNPNNPTGDAYSPDTLREFVASCRDAGTTAIVDEAFLDFTDEPTLAGVPGTVVLRSLTKVFGLPGLRAGFAVAVGDLRDRMEVARPAWALSTPAADVGAHCLGCGEFVADTRERVERERARMRDALSHSFDVHPSDAPFLLLDAGERDVDAVLDHARENGIVLRDARTFRGLDSHVRVAIRRPRENDRLLALFDSTSGGEI